MCHMSAISPDQARPSSAANLVSSIEAEIVAAAVHVWDPALSVEQHDGYDLQRSIIVSGPSDAAIIVDRDAAGLRVSSMVDDLFHPGEGRFQSLMSALDAIKTMTLELLIATHSDASVSQQVAYSGVILG